MECRRGVRNFWVAVLFTTLFLPGCGTGEPQDEALTSTEQALTTSSYVTIRRDTRKCAWPYCGGYFVKKMNGSGTETYVARLDFSAANLDQATVDKVIQAPDVEIALRGYPSSYSYSYRVYLNFTVSEAYRGMPGVLPVAGEPFYKAADRNPPIVCITWPCNNEMATLVNTSTTTDFTDFSVARASKTLVDQTWLISRVRLRGAIVAAKFSPGRVGPGGTEKILDASQVYVRLPERVGPCPALPEPSCAAGTVPIYTRTPDRCVVFSKCVVPGYCIQTIPDCAVNYSLVSWPATDPNACNAYACDPTFTR